MDGRISINIIEYPVFARVKARLETCARGAAMGGGAIGLRKHHAVARQPFNVWSPAWMLWQYSRALLLVWHEDQDIRPLARFR